MSAADRLNEIEARAKDADKAGVFESDYPTWAAWEAAWDSSTDVPALVAALRAVLDEVAKVQRDADMVAINPRPGGKVLAGERWRVAEQFRIRIEEALS